jgi:hypothetical protein
MLVESPWLYAYENSHSIPSADGVLINNEVSRYTASHVGNLWVTRFLFSLSVLIMSGFPDFLSGKRMAFFVA